MTCSAATAAAPRARTARSSMQTESLPPESIATTPSGGAISPPETTRSSSRSESTRMSLGGVCGDRADDVELGRGRETLQGDLADRLEGEAVPPLVRLGDPVGDQDLAGE